MASLTHFPSGLDVGCARAATPAAFSASAGDQAIAQEAYAAGLVER